RIGLHSESTSPHHSACCRAAVSAANLSHGVPQKRPTKIAASAIRSSTVTPHDKLFIPGPVEVSEKTLAAFSRPMIGHRGEAFKNLYREIHPRLQGLVGTKQPVFLYTSSACGVMEAAIRSVERERVLC